MSPNAGKAEVTNEALTDLRVEKEWSKGASIGSETIYIQLYKNDVAEGQPVALSGINMQHTYENLKVVPGAVYTVKEGKIASGAFVPFDGPFELNGMHMLMTGPVVYSDSAKTTIATTLDGAISPFAGVAVITNELVKGRISLKKTDAVDNDKTLVGASFKLFCDADTPQTGSATYDATVDIATVKDASNNDTFTTGADGTIRLPDLDPGTYWLKEIAAPTGYMLRDLDHPTGIVVSDEGVVSVIADATYEMKMTPVVADTDGDGVYTLTVPNLHTYMLPAAGGLGYYPFLIGGAFICAYSMGGTKEARRRRRRKGGTLPGDVVRSLGGG